MWPDQNTSLRLAGLVIALAWFGGYLLGDHPDGAILGFAGSMFLLAGGGDHRARVKKERSQRKPRKPQAEDDES